MGATPRPRGPLARIRRRPESDPTPAQARRRLRAITSLRMAPGQVVAAVITALLGIALVAQVRAQDEAGLSQLRESELVALLDDVSGRVDALQREVVELEADRRQLQGQQGDVAAADAARQRLESYAILAGTVPVEGPGITVVVDDPDGVMTQTMLLDAVQELRDAGAEAIQVGNVRVVASSHVGVAGGAAAGTVTLDGAVLVPPFRILAVGEAHTLAGGLAIPGGFLDSLRGAGASAQVVEDEQVLVDAVRPAPDPRWAEPVPATPSS
ncbi:DUF881 domain-containing protein [Ornithinimicrobium sp. W1679]|uniref:DUF881 domain-containing protein n=1 Tax=Ornithinimicrobium sp. W1679 TaxID=3418770 RepID=UPI003CEB52AA